MKLKKNINYKIIILLNMLFTIIIQSCENGFVYERVKLNGKDLSIEVLNNNFIIDTVIINVGNKNFYKAHTLKNKTGSNKFFLNKTNNSYQFVKNDLENFFKKSKINKNDIEIIIYIRLKNSKNSKIEMKRAREIQEFNSGIFPKNNQILEIYPITRH